VSDAGAPIRGVIFDFHSTLGEELDRPGWIRAAWARLGRGGEPDPRLAADLAAHLEVLWEHGVRLDPESTRDLSAADHRRVFGEAVAVLPGVEPDLVEALYATMPRQWVAYTDAEPVLRELKRRGIRVVVLSNIGFDIADHLAEVLPGLIDGVVLSYQVGVVKPDPKIFQYALDALGVPASEALMVGDSWRADAGAAEVGIRTLVLPRTTGPVHGLDLVLRLVSPEPSPAPEA
jgi:HAD superfamily hydrolase (TIGR01509 family)